MGNRSDRVFHLSIAGIAIALTMVSGLSVVNQWDLQWLQTWIRRLPTLTEQRLMHSRLLNSSVVPIEQTNSGSDIAGMPAYHEKDNASLVKVVAATPTVPESSLVTVRQLLQRYNIVSTDSEQLQMNLSTPVTIYVAQTPADYDRALANLGLSPEQAKQLTMDTGGFTQDSDIVIPMFQNTDAPDLANTLAHELTHAILNQNTGSIPSWINEGLAVHDGMLIQARVEDPVAYAGYERQMAESVIAAELADKLLPLTGDENKVLADNAPYDLELQDWLAVSDLLINAGYPAMRDYLYRINEGESDDTAFFRSFGEIETTFNANFTDLLSDMGKQADEGVTLQLYIPASYQGYIRILQHGKQTWQGFQTSPGPVTVRIKPDGSIQGPKNLTDPTYDSTPPDNDTLYVNLDPLHTLTYEGQSVQDAGFAFDYHYGMYSFVNTWITTENGKSTYGVTPELFGVRVTAISGDGSNPLTRLLIPPSSGD